MHCIMYPISSMTTIVNVCKWPNQILHDDESTVIGLSPTIPRILTYGSKNYKKN